MCKFFDKLIEEKQEEEKINWLYLEYIESLTNTDFNKHKQQYS